MGNNKSIFKAATEAWERLPRDLESDKPPFVSINDQGQFKRVIGTATAADVRSFACCR
jgi:hypothetical protein